MSPALVFLTPLIQWLRIGALILLIGTALARLLVDRHLSGAEQGSRIRIEVGLLHAPRLLATFLFALCLARGATQLLSFMLPGEIIDMTFAQAVLTEGSWGHAWLLQTCTAALLFAATTLIRSRPRAMAMAVLLALPLLIWGESGMGHAADARFWPIGLARLLYSFHLFGAGLWLGTLAIVSLILLPPLRQAQEFPALTGLIQGFSRQARSGVLLVAITGLIMASVIGQSPALALGSTWGKLLLLKLGIFLGTGAIGLWNWKVISPALAAGQGNSPNRLRNSVVVELLLGAALLAVTALLIGSAPPTVAPGP